MGLVSLHVVLAKAVLAAGAVRKYHCYSSILDMEIVTVIVPSSNKLIAETE